MKKIYTIAAALIMTVNLWAQSPEKMSYQAVVRNTSNALVATQTVGMQLSILQGSASGTAVYVETQTPTTNTNGLVNLEIGNGTIVSGIFATIDWSNGPYFIKTETDPTGGTSYTITGTTQLMSVPYALYAKTAESVTGTITETDPVFGSSIASGISPVDTSNWSNHFDGQYSSLTGRPTNVSSFTNDTGYLTSEVDGSNTNEIQALTISNDTVYLSNGGFVKLPAGFNGQYSSLIGAPTNVSSFTNDAGYLTSEVDGSNTNELQTISRTGTAVTLSNGGGSYTDSVNTYTAGANITISPSNVISATGGSTDNFYLGQDTLGGIVYYIYRDATGTQHGLIVSKTETYQVWQATGTLTAADRTEDGAYNTTLMTGSAAASYVASLGVGWYVPSIDELGLLYYNRFATNRALRAGGFTLLSKTAGYWSSTEENTTSSFCFRFYYGEVAGFNKTTALVVRAVKAF